MDNRISEIRRQIRSLRISMLDAEAVMREQISRGEDCAFVAGEMIKMRLVMARLVDERTKLGDREPIVVTRDPNAQRLPASRPATVRAAKLHLFAKAATPASRARVDHR